MTRKLHKWAGLLAAFWLLILGATGILLDHPDWRWPNQFTVPQSWGSPDLTRFIRITLMRRIAVDPDDDTRWLGASERGLWSSDDRGDNWRAINFDGANGTPQVFRLLPHPALGFDRTLIATDDGIFALQDSSSAARFSLDGQFVNSIAATNSGSNILAVSERSTLHLIDLENGESTRIQSADIEPVIADSVPLSRWILNTHFGHGIAEGGIGVLINDFGGLALIVLATTGLLYWYLRRRWRRKPGSATPGQKRRTTAWLYRSHAPIIGVLGAIPVLYLAVTGIAGNHARALYDWAAEISVPAPLVPAGFSMRSLDGDIQDIVAVPGKRDEWLIATRKGLYRSHDAGRNWTPDDSLPIQKADYGNSLNLFRVADTLFIGAGLDANYFSTNGGHSWAPVSGPFTGMSSAAFSDGRWHVRNSQAVHVGVTPAKLEESDVRPPPLEGMPLFLFAADVHTGHAIHPQFYWLSDLLTLFAVVLVITGPIVWWRRKWM